VHVTVRLFARLRELVGAGELQRTTDEGATVATVWQSLVAEYPAIAPYAESMSCAVNADYARMTTRVSEGDEVAFLPPVSGGGQRTVTAIS
jgi:sulfur-carrier protein